jgi:hypothetical protein
LIQLNTLLHVGGDWEMEEEGESAVHLRRRLSKVEMQILHDISPACPVFTHGKALGVIA